MSYDQSSSVHDALFPILTLSWRLKIASPHLTIMADCSRTPHLQGKLVSYYLRKLDLVQFLVSHGNWASTLPHNRMALHCDGPSVSISLGTWNPSSPIHETSSRSLTWTQPTPPPLSDWCTSPWTSPLTWSHTHHQLFAGNSIRWDSHCSHCERSAHYWLKGVEMRSCFMKVSHWLSRERTLNHVVILGSE